MGRKCGRVFRKKYRGPMDKTKERWNQEREVCMPGLRGDGGGEDGDNCT